MFELLLNAVKVALSKDARDSVSSVIELLRRSPDWEKSIGTIEARISLEARERVQLIEDLIADKLMLLKYKRESIEAFRTASTELTANAFEHGIISRQRAIIRIVVETTPSYVATTVHNPKGSKFQLERALESAAEHRIKSHNSGRGRGLILVSRRVDTIEMIGSEAIKTLVYRDAVEIKTHKESNTLIAVVTAGQANPSLPRRILEYFDEHVGKKIVLCLDPQQFDAYRRGSEDVNTRRTPKSTMLHVVLAEVQRRNVAHPDICVVGERDFRDLLPELDSAPTIGSAIARLRQR